ncbi:serine/threonine-protein kinase [Halomicronema hongdechloris]|uniref:serine/threonine-protein kinase n=1 Tax=Halomicronema hongdechloris TaxID=1209493 RepID=UPI001CED811D|nr:serine/threonine-protein kinase [Halomicronema hongdechloris]
MPSNPRTAERCQGCGHPLVKRLRGRYIPIKLLGQGGFGRTFLGLDTDRLNSPCVIKQFAPQTQGTKSFDKAVKLFEQEAMRLHDLGEHPQIPTLLAYFAHDHYLYLVQQSIEGTTLYQELQERGAYDGQQVRQLLLDLLPVLQFIHHQGVIHRDITPTNILRRQQDGKAILIDFGVAKQFSEAVTPQPGTRIGTEGYSPIEQLRGGHAYPASDLYSLGVTCLHLLTNRKPEDLYDPLQGQWQWRQILQAAGRSIDPPLAQVLERLVQDLVGDRYQSAQDALRDLQGNGAWQGVVPGWVRQHPAGPISSPPQPPSSPPSEPPEPSEPPSTARPATTKPQTSSPPPTSRPQSSGRRPRSGTPRSRGWHCVRTVVGHRSWVMAVAFNPKTPALVSGSLDDTIRVWHLPSGKEFYSLEAHPRGVNDVVISRGGQVMASCGDDHTVRVWNLAQGKVLHTLTGHLRDVMSVAMGQRGFLLASGGEDRSLMLWKLDQGRHLKTLRGTAGIIKAVAMTADEQTLVSGGLDNQVRLWDIATGTLVRTLSGHLHSVNDLAISRDDKLIASASKDGTVRLWELATGTLLQTLAEHTQDVNGVAIAPDSRTLVSGSNDGTVKLWDLQTGQCLYSLSGHTGAVQAVAIHSSGRLIASASTDKTIRLWKWTG